MQSIKSLPSPACTISLASFKGSDAILAFAGVRSAAHLIAASLPGASLSKQNITWSNNSNHSIFFAMYLGAELVPLGMLTTGKRF